MENTRKKNSTNAFNQNDTLVTCPFMRALILIQGRWKLVVICRLRDYGTQRFSELRTLIPNASKQMLAKTLNELVASGIIERNELRTFPQTVEYSLSRHGVNLLPVIEHLKQWGLKVNPLAESSADLVIS